MPQSFLHKFKSNNLPTRPRDAEAGERFSIMHQSFVHNDCVSRIGVSHSVSVRARPSAPTSSWPNHHSLRLRSLVLVWVLVLR